VEYLTPLLEVLIESVGPVGAILAFVALFLGYLVWSDRKSAKEEMAIPADYQTLLNTHREDMSRYYDELSRMNERYNEAISDNTRVLERLAVIFEERTRPRS
jgi:hypothetical protein